MSRSSYVLKTLAKYASFQSPACPYCLSASTTTVQWKAGLWQLRRCTDCSLRFRFPKDVPEENATFYQKAYRQDNVTDLPPEGDIPGHIADHFAAIGRDLSTHLETMKAVVPTGKVLDYGCSWGYCVHQFSAAGYEAMGFEVSRPRVEYGRRVLKLNLTTDASTLPIKAFDLVYSAHVLEHIPDPRSFMAVLQRVLKPGGKLFLYVPNCSGEQARRLGVGWGPMMNEKHVLALTAEFFEKNLPSHGFSVEFSSSPYDSPPGSYQDAKNLEGEELLVVGTLHS